MPIEPLFSLAEPGLAGNVTFSFDGQSVVAPAGISVAAALLLAGISDFRSSVVGHTARGPYCMMGVCFECLVEIDDIPARQSCLITVQEGMVIRRQEGAASLDVASFGEDQ
jgi:predicted molibdopterin-dependent oxidoreductase YjgC